jgi:hypothetical protein
MTVAGPLANLASGLFLLVLPVHKPLLVGFFIVFSFFFGLVNFVPFCSFGTSSDGIHLLVLLWQRPKHERRLALATVLDHMNEGLELHQISSDLIAAAIAVQDRSLETLVAHIIAYAGAYNQQRDDDAARLLETCLRLGGEGPNEHLILGFSQCGLKPEHASGKAAQARSPFIFRCLNGQ